MNTERKKPEKNRFYCRCHLFSFFLCLSFSRLSDQEEKEEEKKEYSLSTRKLFRTENCIQNHFWQYRIWISVERRFSLSLSLSLSIFFSSLQQQEKKKLPFFFLFPLFFSYFSISFLFLFISSCPFYLPPSNSFPLPLSLSLGSTLSTVIVPELNKTTNLPFQDCEITSIFWKTKYKCVHGQKVKRKVK